MISVENLCHVYPARRGQNAPREALRDVSFFVPQGKRFALLGPNGGGKTTTFRILSTLLKPTSGRVKLSDVDVLASPDRARHKLGIVFQSPSLDAKLTVWENALHQGHLYGLQGSELNTRIEAALKALDVLDRRNDIVETLSGGLARRVEIAKSLLHRPAVLLLDEPTTGLDPRARRDVWSFVGQLQKDFGMTILFTTHLLEEADDCDDVAILHQGRLVAQGKPSVLKSQIGGDVVTIQGKQPEALASKIESRFQSKTRVVQDRLYIEIPNGHEFIPELMRSFPNEIDSVTLGKPTLEDVFIHYTGNSWS